MAILDYRRHESMTCVIKAIQSESESLRNIALTTQEANRIVEKLTGKMQRDTNLMKILALVALFYLPASLIAVSTTIMH